MIAKWIYDWAGMRFKQDIRNHSTAVCYKCQSIIWSRIEDFSYNCDHDRAPHNAMFPKFKYTNGVFPPVAPIKDNAC